MSTVRFYRWTQPSCKECYAEHYPGLSNPHRIVEHARESERCCYCGVQNFDGLYVRVDPTEVPYPSLLKQ
jgi:hypothetical protein